MTRPPSTADWQNNHARSGNVLVLFAFLVFAALSMAALVVDIGTARLTQMQMQTVADSAALTGLRYRDDIPAAWQPSTGYTPNLPAGLVAACGPQPSSTYDPTNAQWQVWINAARRFTAGQIVADTFDDDLNPSDGDPMQFGAGPIIDFSGNVGDSSLAAGQLITVPSPAVYKPNLQANTSNVADGDLVAGTYGWNQAYQNANPTATQDEGADYSRRDFVPDNPTGSVAETGFLVRLRRSNENFTSSTGVASNGPALSFLFGRGSLMARSSSNPTDLTVASGITVRAAAIAAAGSASLGTSGGTTTTVPYGHVLSAGPADTVDIIRGVAPFGLTATYWSSLNNSANQTGGQDAPTVNPSTGIITSSLPPQPGAASNPNTVEAGVAGTNQTALVTIGQIYTAAGNDSPLGASPTLLVYVPIYDTIGTTARTIVGFGFVQWTYTTGQLSVTVPWSSAKRAGRPNCRGERDGVAGGGIAVVDSASDKLADPRAATLRREPVLARVPSGSSAGKSLFRSQFHTLSPNFTP